MTNQRTLTEATPLELDGILSGLDWATEWPQNLQDFLAQNPGTRLPAKPSGRNINHQMVAIFARNLGRGFTRDQLTKIGEVLGRTGGDAIQWANKTERLGIKLDKTSGGALGYGFAELTFSDKYLAMSQDNTTEAGRDASVARTRRLLQDMADGKFEKGHKDPRLPLSDENLVMQPYEINRSYRDRYIFDDNGLPKVPNPAKFIEDPEAYYSRADLRLIYEALKNRFEYGIGLEES